MCGDNTALHALWGRIMRKQLGSQTLFQCLRWLSDSIEINGPPFWIPWGLDYLLKRSRLSGGWVGAGGVVGTRAVARPAPLYFGCWSSAQQSKPLASKSLSNVGTTWWRGWGEGGVGGGGGEHRKNCLFTSSLQQPPPPARRSGLQLSSRRRQPLSPCFHGAPSIHIQYCAQHE